MALGACLVGAWGCAASPTAPPAAPEPSAEALSTEPTTVEEAQAELERARAELGGTPVAPLAAATGTTTAAAEGGTPKTEAARAPSPSPVAKQEMRCASACRAMTSMKRAVDAICRLAGESDGRCTDARKTLRDGEAKVAGCGC